MRTRRVASRPASASKRTRQHCENLRDGGNWLIENAQTAEVTISADTDDQVSGIATVAPLDAAYRRLLLLITNDLS